MESPVVVDKPPEYHGNPNDERGFPFEEEEPGAWSSLAARHPDIAARLRQRAPQSWPRKRRPDSHGAEDFGDDFGFDRFGFDSIPPEFREHLPSGWHRRFGRDEPPQEAHHSQQPHPEPAQQAPPQSSPKQHTISTQTEYEPPPQNIPQYGLRNTVDLGQKSPADPSLADAEERNQRSMSAPPDARNMSGKDSKQEHIVPIRLDPDYTGPKPAPNRPVDTGSHFGETFEPRSQFNRSKYFDGDEMDFPSIPKSGMFAAPPGFRQGPAGQPYMQSRVFPQRAQSPRDNMRHPEPPHHQQQHPQQYAGHPQAQAHAQAHAQTHAPSQAQAHAHPQAHTQAHAQAQAHQNQAQEPQAPQPPPSQPSPPPKPPANDDISKILAIQTKMLNLMTEVENFTGTKEEKQYRYLDEMLTNCLCDLDAIEIKEGMDNIRTARKEAVRCIHKCIAVLEAKAEKNKDENPKTQDVEMKAGDTQPIENGELDVNEQQKEVKEDQKAVTEDPKAVNEDPKAVNEDPKAVKKDPKEVKDNSKLETKPEENKEQAQAPPEIAEKAKEVDTKTKKGAKSKDKKAKDSKKELTEKMDVDASSQ